MDDLGELNGESVDGTSSRSCCQLDKSPEMLHRAVISLPSMAPTEEARAWRKEEGKEERFMDGLGDDGTGDRTL